jgi:hypothetical protein
MRFYSKARQNTLQYMFTGIIVISDSIKRGEKLHRQAQSSIKIGTRYTKEAKRTNCES